MVTFRDLKTINLAALNYKAANIEWHTINNNIDHSDRMRALNLLILQLLNKHSPIKRRRVTGPVSTWITQDILTLMAERDCS